MAAASVFHIATAASKSKHGGGEPGLGSDDDGAKVFTVETAWCKYSGHLSNLIEFEDPDETYIIPSDVGILPETLEHMVLFLEIWHNTLHDASRVAIEHDLKDMSDLGIPSELYRYIMPHRDPAFLVNLIKAADFFNIDPLLNLAVKQLVSLMKQFRTRDDLIEWLSVPR